MRRVYKTRETIKVGQCIYCGATEELTEEHITPYGLSGRLVLLDASCKKCAKITGSNESIILGRMKAARAAIRTMTRNPKDRKGDHRMTVEKNGERVTIEAPLEDHWKVIRLPIFPAPACIDRRPYQSGIESYSSDQVELSESGEDVAKKHGVDSIVFPEFNLEIFARFVAKIAYGYAVAQYSLNAFEKVYVVPAILGESNDVGRWVGCSDVREFPARDGITISVGFKILPDRDLLVKLKLFAQFDGAEYVVIVGKMKESKD